MLIYPYLIEDSLCWIDIPCFDFICYNTHVTAPIQVQEGGVTMIEFLIALAATVAGGVACHYIIKWLDGRKKR